MSEISSGLVAVRIDTDGYPLVRLSDAEEIISDLQRKIALGIASRDAEIDEREQQIAKQSAALKLAREALFDMQDSYAAVHGWKDSFVIAATTAIAAINEVLGKVK